MFETSFNCAMGHGSLEYPRVLPKSREIIKHILSQLSTEESFMILAASFVLYIIIIF